MNEKQLFESIGNLDESLLARSEKMFAKNGELSSAKTWRFPKVLRTGLIAAALVCVSVVSVYAVSNLISMRSGSIDLFHKAPSRQQTTGSAGTLRGSYTQAAEDMETFVAEVGMSVTDNGVVVTLDQVSMDAASLDLFYTLSGEEALKQVREQMQDKAPDWTALEDGCSFLNSRVNGKQVAEADQSDAYLAEDGTVKIWEHYLLSEMPQGEVVTLELDSERMLGRSGSWSFRIDLDGKSVRSGAKMAQPGVYKMKPYSLENDGLPGKFLDMDMHLEYLAFGPKGGVIHTAHQPVEFNNGEQKIAAETGLDPRMAYIVDDTGRELHAFQNENSVLRDTLNLTAADPKASGITLTPVQYRIENGKSIRQEHTVTTEQLKAGVRIETSPLGGFEVQNYTIQNGVICYEMVPFGWDSGERLTPKENNVPTLNGHSGLISGYVDPRTGVITVRIDYYAAQDADLEAINEWNYYWIDAELDESQAVTLPLTEVEP